MRIHREAKEQPVYALVVAKDGAKLQPAKEGRIGIRTGRGSLSGRGVDMPALARGLSDWVGRTVVDKTGLTGN